MKAYPLCRIFSSSLLFTLLTFHGCTPPADRIVCDCSRQEKEPSFCGTIRDSNGRPIADALVEVGKSTATTNKMGMFTIRVDAGRRYVLNVTRLGFGFVSKIYDATACNAIITMSTATVIEIEPEDIEAPEAVIVIEDTTPPPPESAPLSSNITTVGNPLDTVPFVYDARGRLIGFKAPSTVEDTYAAAAQFAPPEQGATIEVLADALTEEPATSTAGVLQNRKPKGSIVGSISTVDIYSPDGMPGDYTIRYRDGSRGYMETFGAADVNFYRDGKPLQLKKGQYATLTIPVDTLALMYYGKKLRETIPLFVYDKNIGEWVRDRDRWNEDRENIGILNRERNAYVAKISHFSVYNMDEEFMNPSCTRICNASSGADNIPTTSQIEVAVPPHINRFPFTAGCSGGCPGGGCGGIGSGINIHAIARMKPDQPIGLRIFDNLGVVTSTYVFYGGPPSTGSDVFYASCGDITPHCNCPVEVTIRNTDCGMSTSTPGTMDGPVLALRREGATSNFSFSWVYIDPAATITPASGSTPASIINPAGIQYKLQYIIPPVSSTLDQTGTAWTDVPIGASATATGWKVEADAVISSVPVSNVVFFRVAVRIGSSGSYKTSTVYIINHDTDPSYDAGTLLYQDYDGATCQFVGTTVDI